MKGLFQCPPRATPWVVLDANLSPCKGKSFETPGAICKAFALTGRLADCLYTQGVALGYELLPLQGVLLVGAVALYLCFTLRPEIFNSLRPVTVGSGRAA